MYRHAAKEAALTICGQTFAPAMACAIMVGLRLQTFSRMHDRNMCHIALRKNELTNRLRWCWIRIAASIKYHGIPFTILWSGMHACGFASSQWFFDYRARHFDRRHNVDTADKIEMAELGMMSDKVDLCNHYEPCLPESLFEILSKLSFPLQDHVFIDLGSGKGVGMLVASMFAFKRIVGVEYSPRVANISRVNLRNFPVRLQKCRIIEVIDGDATKCDLPSHPLVVFLYNPFKEDLMRQALDNLANSLAQHPRHVVVVYYNPVCKNVFAETSFLRLIEIRDEYPSYTMYETLNDAPRQAAAVTEGVCQGLLPSEVAVG